MTNPTLITTPFAENGDKNIIPESVGANPQNATMQAGFPPITQQKISEGGIPPERNDFNGILNLYGQHIVHLNKGLPYEFDQAFADAIGGYPLNARLMLDNGDIVRSTVANNAVNPNVDMTGWIKTSDINHLVGTIYYAPNVGMVGDGETSDSQALKDVLLKSLDGHITLILDRDKDYKIDLPVLVSGSKGVTIVGNGSKLSIGKIELNPNDNYQSIIHIVCDKNAFANVNFIDFYQDGTPSFYNPWEYYVAGKRWYSVVGIEINFAQNVTYKNVKQEKIIGYGSRWFDCKNVTVDGFRCDDVGGHNGLFGNDSLGDCFYIGWRSGKTNYSFNNVVANGVEVEDKYSGVYYSSRSRIFLTIENLNTDEYQDETTLITLNNVTARKYQRGIHAEIGVGDVIINADNYDVRADCINLSSGIGGRSVMTCTNTKMRPYNRDYNGTAGINWGFELTLGAGCIVDGQDSTGALLAHHDTSVTHLRDGALVTNIRNILTNNGTYTADGAEMQFSEAFNDYYHYFGKPPEIKRSKLTNIENTVVKEISPFVTQPIIEDCELHNVYFARSCLQHVKSKLFLNTSLPNYNTRYMESLLADIYLNNVLYHKYGELNVIRADSPYNSSKDLLLKGEYSTVGKTLADMPAGWTGVSFIKVDLYNPDLDYLNGVFQQATNMTTLETKRRIRQPNGYWSDWV